MKQHGLCDHCADVVTGNIFGSEPWSHGAMESFDGVPTTPLNDYPALQVGLWLLDPEPEGLQKQRA
jgi:hypothetical protein